MKTVKTTKLPVVLVSDMLTLAFKRFSRACKLPCSNNVVRHHNGIIDGVSVSFELIVYREYLTSRSKSAMNKLYSASRGGGGVPRLKMTEVLVENFRKHPEMVPESHFVGVASNSFTPLTGTNSEIKNLVAIDMTVFKQKIEK